MKSNSRINTIENILSQINAPPYRIEQVFEGVYQKYVKSYNDITSLPKDLRQALENELGPQVLCLNNVSETESEQADKVLFETKDKNRIEAVLMTFKPNAIRTEEHQALCVSSQSGCALGCTFCATGAIGFKKNLTADEITDQILYFLQQGKTVRNITFMGMGEPFVNPNLFEALKIITDKDKMAYGQRHISISTVGIVPGIQRLQKEYPEINLTFSLHSPFPEQRLRLMPITKAYPITTVMKALKDYTKSTNKKVFIAYVLLDGINDSTDHAKGTAQLIKKQGEKQYLYHVNLIRFNPGATFKPFDKPSVARVDKFRKALDSYGIRNTLRHSFGVKIDAGCGQLYAKYERIIK
jgi:23S rRNA (adenine-C8)-methyltransferase